MCRCRWACLANNSWCPLLPRLVRGRHHEARRADPGHFSQASLFQLTYRELAADFRDATAACGVECLASTFYCLRHGGASHDRLARARTLEEVRQRGAWRAHSSVTPYDKHARLGLQIARLGRACLCRLESMAAEFEKGFTRRWPHSFGGLAG